MVRIFFRVDAASWMGSGHVMRCLALADAALESEAEIHFICRDFDGHLGDLIQQRGFSLHLLPAASHYRPANIGDYDQWLGGSWRDDAEQTLAVIGSCGTGISYLVVDHYALDIRWQSRLRPRLDKIVVIDDLANRSHDCDLLLDQTFARQQEDYRPFVSAKTQCLLGAEFALLRPQFYQRREALSAVGPASNIRLLLALGGGDGALITEQVLRLLTTACFPAPVYIDVVLSETALNYHAVCTLIEQIPHQVTLYNYVEGMASLMVEATLAIGAPGVSSWERCCLGLPTLLIPFADNQRQVAKSLEAAGAVHIVERHQLEQQLVDVITNLYEHRKLYSRSGLAVCRGLGARVTMQYICELPAKDGAAVQLRPAEQRDIEQVFIWQSLPQTRCYARNAGAPVWEEHQSWMVKRLADPYCYFYMIMHDSVAAGVLRLDRLDKGRYEISIYLDPVKYQLGIAQVALRQVADIHQEIDIEAEVLVANIASQKLFLSCGYKPIAQGKYLLERYRRVQ